MVLTSVDAESYHDVLNIYKAMGGHFVIGGLNLIKGKSRRNIVYNHSKEKQWLLMIL